jgi:hypothetical protein
MWLLTPRVQHVPQTLHRNPVALISSARFSRGNAKEAVPLLHQCDDAIRERDIHIRAHLGHAPFFFSLQIEFNLGNRIFCADKFPVRKDNLRCDLHRYPVTFHFSIL